MVQCLGLKAALDPLAQVDFYSSFNWTELMETDSQKKHKSSCLFDIGDDHPSMSHFCMNPVLFKKLECQPLLCIGCNIG